MPRNKAIGSLDWFTYSENTLDGRSRKKAYDLFESGLLQKLEPVLTSHIGDRYFFETGPY